MQIADSFETINVFHIGIWFSFKDKKLSQVSIFSHLNEHKI